MLTDMEQGNILDDFAMTSPLGPETLRSYVKKYPQLTLELTDLYHELLMVDLSAADGMQLNTKSVVENSQQSETSVASALSGVNLRKLAQKLGLPRDYIAGFRDRKVRLGSIPGALLINLARSASVSVHQMIKHFQDIAGSTPQMAHKADGKPQSSAAVEYDDFVKGLGLNESELEALKILSVTDGQD